MTISPEDRAGHLRSTYAQYAWTNMKDYLLHTLSAGDFEELVVKICHEILGFGTISFSSGPDGGRDAFFDGTAQRFPSKADPWTGKFVIQAKHTEKDDVSCSETAC